MSISAVLDVLTADPAVTAIVGAGDDARISPIQRDQDQTVPALTITNVATTGLYTLNGPDGISQNVFQVDSWASTYEAASELALACRTALDAAGFVMNSQIDNFDSSAELSGIYSVTQEFSVWL